MTAIAGLIHKGSVWMGGDSAGVADYRLHVRKDPKVFAKGELLIGFTSSFRMGQILRYHLDVPDATEGQDDYEYMVREFVPAVRRCLKEHGYTKVDNNRESSGTFLVGRRGRLFEIDDDLQVAEALHPFNACGCGIDLVLGSLHATQGGSMDPAQRVNLALQAAECFSAGVRGPFIVLSIHGPMR